jgi:hypothetical protein
MHFVVVMIYSKRFCDRCVKNVLNDYYAKSLKISVFS